MGAGLGEPMAFDERTEIADGGRDVGADHGAGTGAGTEAGTAGAGEGEEGDDTTSASFP